MSHEVLMRSPCPAHSTNECIACDGAGYVHQWVPAVWKSLPVRVAGKAHFMSKEFLMLGDPKELDTLDLLAGNYAKP
jgi:hypothetical protein